MFERPLPDHLQPFGSQSTMGGDVLRLSFLLAQHHMLGQSTRYRVTLRLPMAPRGLLANGCILNVSDLTLE